MLEKKLRTLNYKVIMLRGLRKKIADMLEENLALKMNMSFKNVKDLTYEEVDYCSNLMKDMEGIQHQVLLGLSDRIEIKYKEAVVAYQDCLKKYNSLLDGEYR